MRFIKRLVILGVVLFGGLWFYGRSLPREHVATSTIVLVAPADSVWKLIRNFPTHTAWWDDVKSVKRITGRPRESWEEDMGIAGTIQMEVTREAVGRQLVVTILNETQQDWGGSWTYDVTTTGAGCEVTITETGWVEAPIFRVVAKFRGEHRTIDSVLRALSDNFGEMASPRHG